MYLNWQLWTFFGYLTATQINSIIPIGLSLSFVMVPAFLPLIMQQINDKSSILCALIAGSGALIFSDFPNQLGVLSSALLAIFLILIFETKYNVTKNMGDKTE